MERFKDALRLSFGCTKAIACVVEFSEAKLCKAGPKTFIELKSVDEQLGVRWVMRCFIVVLINGSNDGLAPRLWPSAKLWIEGGYAALDVVLIGNWQLRPNGIGDSPIFGCADGPDMHEFCDTSKPFTEVWIHDECDAVVLQHMSLNALCLETFGL